jgi:hypothetical protein
VTNKESDADMKKEIKDVLEKQYREITSMYDMAEELASTIESDFVQNPDAQLALVEPLITQIADSTDILAEEFINILEKPASKKSAKNKVEAALRKMFQALEEYRNRVGLRSKKVLSALANIADPIVDKIRKQAEKITIIFMTLIELSLERIMHKYEIEELKRSNAKVTGMLLQTR